MKDNKGLKAVLYGLGTAVVCGLVICLLRTLIRGNTSFVQELGKWTNWLYAIIAGVCYGFSVLNKSSKNEKKE